MDELNVENFDDVVNNNEFVVVDYWAEWCAPCKELSPVFEAASQELPDVVFKKINVDEEEDLAISNNVRGLPSVLLYKDGVEVDRVVGLVHESELVKRIKKSFDL